MKMKTAELTGRALDYAVALAEGYLPYDDYGIPKLVFPGSAVMLDALQREDYFKVPSFSTDWSRAGPIIERERICLEWVNYDRVWEAHISSPPPIFETIGYAHADKPLEAAMVAYIRMKLGDEVDIPDQL